MASVDELERRWLASAAEATGRVCLVVVRSGGGAHATPDSVVLDVHEGLAGDRWFADAKRDPEAQVSLIERRVVAALVEGDTLHVPGDNLVVDLALDETALPVGSRLRVGSALLELTAKPHTGCSKFRARVGDEALRWVNAREHRHRRMRGVYARVIEGGVVAVGDRIVKERAP